MNFRRFLGNLFGPRHRPASKPRPRPRVRLGCEPLESRITPTSDLIAIDDTATASGKDLLVPVAVQTPPPGGTVSYSVQSDNPAVSASVVTGGRSLRLNVSGTDSNGNPFSGELTFRLFEDLAPIATERIITLTQQGFYNGLGFHRIVDGFVAQGGDPNGDGTGGSPLPDFIDEFNRFLTFVSRGLLALANSGDDTNNSQFFIVDIDLSLAQLPQHLNFNHTIFGILTSGFDTFQRIMTTPVTGSRPNSPVTINSASIFTDTTRGVVRVSPTASFTGNATLTVTAEDGTGPSNPEAFSVQVSADTVNDRPFLGPVANQATTVGTGVSFTLSATDLENDALTFVVRDANNFSATPANVRVDIDQSTGLVTLTPEAGFTGTIQLLAGVRDQTNRGGAFTPLDDRSQFDTQRFTLTVTGDIDLNPESDTGVLDDDNVTGEASPTLTITAEPGRTVTIRVNDGADLPTTESSPGRYTVTLPPNSLRVGANTVTGTVNGSGTPRELTPLTITFAPSLQGVYVVPGAPGETQSITFDFIHTESDFRNEAGVFRVDDFNGSVGGLLPGDPGYAQAALSAARRQVIFSPSDAPGASRTLTFTGGEFFALYLIANNTTEVWLAQNPSNAADGAVLAYFSITLANPDGVNHLSVVDDPVRSVASYAWEDLPGDISDLDYNDLVFVVRPQGSTLRPGDVTAIPGAMGRLVPVTFELLEAAKSLRNANPTSSTSTNGEVGLFRVDGPDGQIGNLTPGTPGYLLAALAPDRRQTIFSPGSALPTVTTLNLTGGQFIGIYFIPNGTADQWRSTNPSNDPNNGLVAFVSLDAANTDGVEHVRNFTPELVTRDEPGANEPLRFHLMGTFGGGSFDFDDVLFSMRVS